VLNIPNERLLLSLLPRLLFFFSYLLQSLPPLLLLPSELLLSHLNRMLPVHVDCAKLLNLFIFKLLHDYQIRLLSLLPFYLLSSLFLKHLGDLLLSLLKHFLLVRLDPLMHLLLIELLSKFMIELELNVKGVSHGNIGDPRGRRLSKGLAGHSCFPKAGCKGSR
jgi:hypothetical protein